jgi:PAS domain S-box-containing protein
MDSRLRVLYADDNQAHADQVQALLATDGLACEIQRVGTRDEFLAALDRGGVDVILSEFSLPWGDGLAAITLARSKCPDVPFIFVTSTLSEDSLGVALQHCATDYVLKDRPVRLLSAVRRALQAIKEKTERKRAQRFQAVEHSVTRILAEADTVEDVMPKILKVICYDMRWEVGVFWRLDEDAQVLRCSEVWHVPTVNLAAFEPLSRSTQLPYGQGLPGRVWASGEPAWIPDASESTNFPRTSAAARDELHGALAFPVRSRETVIGVLEFFSLELRSPDQAQTQLMGALGCLIGQFIKRRRAEEALRESAECFRQLTEHAQEAFWMTDAKRNQVLYVSPQFERLWGRSSSSLYASPQSWLDAIHPEDRGRVLEAAGTKSAAGEYDQVYRIVKPDSSVSRIHHRAVPLRDTSGQVGRIAWIAEEIAEHKQD